MHVGEIPLGLLSSRGTCGEFNAEARAPLHTSPPPSTRAFRLDIFVYILRIVLCIFMDSVTV